MLRSKDKEKSGKLWFDIKYKLKGKQDDNIVYPDSSPIPWLGSEIK